MIETRLVCSSGKN